MNEGSSMPDRSAADSTAPASSPVASLPATSVTDESEGRGENVRDAVNAALHAGASPCQNACPHVIVGRWTALGIANVIARADLEDHR